CSAHRPVGKVEGIARVQSRHHLTGGREITTKKARMTRGECRRLQKSGAGLAPFRGCGGGGYLNGNHIESRLRERRRGRRGSDHEGGKRKSTAAIPWGNCLSGLSKENKTD